MATVDRELKDTIPSFEHHGPGETVDLANWSGVPSTLGLIRGGAEWAAVLLVAVLIVGGTELLLRWFQVPVYIMPTPSQVVGALAKDFHLIAPHVGHTLVELLAGFAIGASTGFLLAAVVTQFPLVEKIIAPYILLLVTTPMLAL